MLGSLNNCRIVILASFRHIVIKFRDISTGSATNICAVDKVDVLKIIIVPITNNAAADVPNPNVQNPKRRNSGLFREIIAPQGTAARILASSPWGTSISLKERKFASSDRNGISLEFIINPLKKSLVF